MIQPNDINKLINEMRQSKSDFAKLKALTELQQLIEKEILEIARKLK